jgi:diguanylate cyclase (GGDEF)-like protein
MRWKPRTGPVQVERELTEIAIGGPAAEQVQATMRRMERREWWLWSNAVLVTMLLLLAIASFALPALLAEVDGSYSFFLNQAVRGLTGLVLLFNFYVVYQQVQINRIRRQLTDQVFAVDKVELLAQEVYKVAVLDPLTGLFNRRYIERRLADEIARTERNGWPLSVILLDLDGFKQVNDTHGHAAGDGFLRAFAERLSKATRGSDVVARYGGDEFLAILPDCRPDAVQLILKRLDRLCLQIGGEHQAIGYSAGWTDYITGEPPEELLRRADAALYANKRRGSQPTEVAYQ